MHTLTKEAISYVAFRSVASTLVSILAFSDGGCFYPIRVVFVHSGGGGSMQGFSDLLGTVGGCGVAVKHHRQWSEATVGCRRKGWWRPVEFFSVA